YQVPRFGAHILINSTISKIISQMPVQANHILAQQQQFGSSGRNKDLEPRSGPGQVYNDTQKAPDYTLYHQVTADSSQEFSYIVVGRIGVVTAAGAK
ncbi:hypothetical protein BY996DRAFT_4569297, partial [Phakopsora pachyrhizi]